MTATPTPAERAQAKRLAYLHPGFSPGRVNAIAQALADVRAPYEAVIERIRELSPSSVKVAESEAAERGRQAVAGTGLTIAEVWE